MQEEHSGSVVECLTSDRGVLVQALSESLSDCVVFLSKTLYLLLCTGYTQETSWFDWNIVDWVKESTQISEMENSVDPDQLASKKPADQDLHCFQNGL